MFVLRKQLSIPDIFSKHYVVYNNDVMLIAIGDFVSRDRKHDTK